MSNRATITPFMEHEAIVEVVEGMAHVLREQLQLAGIDRPVMIGIHTGGVWVAEALHAALGLDEPLCTLDISFYRDDFTRIGLNPTVRPSHIDVELTDRHVILVDDVLQSGRTIRAAMNEIFDFGRPASIKLAVLVERDGRELPIRADAIGLQPTLSPDEYIRLTGPSPLRLEVSGGHVPRGGADEN